MTRKWKCGSSLALPLAAADEAWDAEAAATSVFEFCGFGGRDPDVDLARKAFLAYDANAAADRAGYALPFAKVVRGKLTAVPAGLARAGHLLTRAAIPPDVKSKARAVLEVYDADPYARHGREHPGMPK